MKSKFIPDQQDPSDSFGFLDTAGAQVYANLSSPAASFSLPTTPDVGSPPSSNPVQIASTPALVSEAIQSSSAQSGATSTFALTSGGITINLLFDAAAMAAPASFRAGIQQAASILTAAISDKITVNIGIDYSGTGGGAAAGPDNGLYESYSSVRADLINNATPGDTVFNALPSGSSIQGQSSVAVWNAQLKLWGILGANDTTTDDGSATFATDINPNLLVGVALHELTHAMGRVPYGPPYGSQPDIFDLFRFTSPGTRLINGGNSAPAAYFSVNGGNTKLADFGQTSDPSDFLNSGVQGSNDPFNEFYTGSTSQNLTTVDKELLDVLGFHSASSAVTQPPTLSVHNDPTATGGQPVALSNLVTIADPGHVGYQALELWEDAPNGSAVTGQFVVNGVAQTGGHEIDVAPANVANTVFDAGTLGGTDSLWARLLENDGTLTLWQQFFVTAPAVPQPTLSVHNDPTATGGQPVALSNLVTIADPGHVGYQALELWEDAPNGSAATGQFVVNGVAQTGGHEIDVAPANVANTVFDAGTLGGTDSLWARLLENDGTLTLWQQFFVTAPAVPQPTLSVHNDPTATGGQPVALSSLVTIADPGHVGYQALELWEDVPNGSAATGQFVVNGVAQTGGHEIDVAPANVANTVFDAGTLGGTDSLWARLLENDGTLTLWQQFFVTAPAVPQPTLSVHNDPTATGGQPVALSSLVTIADPGHVGYQALELWEDVPNGSAATGQFVVNGVAQTGGHEIDVAPANVANTVFDAGTLGGTDSLWARLLENDGTLTLWQQFFVTAPAVPQPTLSVHNDPTATGGQPVALSNLVTIADPGHVGYQALELWEDAPNGSAATGQFVVNGVAQTGGHEIDVAPANVANTVFDAGTLGGTDSLWARLLENDGTLTLWQQFFVTAPAVPQPTLSVHNDPTATGGQPVALSSLVTIADPGHVGYQALELWEDAPNGSAATGQFVVNGVAQTGGHEIDVAPANVANTVFDAGTLGGTDSLWARLLENDGTLTLWQQFFVTAPAVPQPTLSVHNDPTATGGQPVALSSLVTIADPGHVGYQALELWEDVPNGSAATGQFVVNGVAQTGGHEIDVAPANVANTVFDAGTLGGTDSLWARLLENDGTLTLWQQFFVTAPAVPQPTVTAAPVSSQSGPMGGTANDATGQVAGASLSNLVVTARQDSFVFAPNFGQVTIANFDPAKDAIQINQSTFANMTALVAATHDDGYGNAVITDAAHDTITIQHITTAQLLAHQSDFHFV